MQHKIEEVRPTSTVTVPFNEADWMQRLLKLNAWVVDSDSAQQLRAYLTGGAITPLVRLPLQSIWQSESFKSARRRASISRWQEGRGAWVAWAEAMLALRSEAEASGDFSLREPGMTLNPAVKGGALSSAWENMATADLSEFVFDGANSIDFRGYVFPYNTTFAQAKFGLSSRRCSTSFRNAKFLMHADFENSVCSSSMDLQGVAVGGALNLTNIDIVDRLTLVSGQLGGAVSFEGAKIGRTAAFNRAVFDKFVSFEGGAFGGATSFVGTIFNDDASFDGARFNSRVTFISTRFIGSADFSLAPFSDDEERYASGQAVYFSGSADFTQVRFDGPATFANATFEETAIFRSAQSSVAFSLANAMFKKAPDFIEASFHEPPRLDDITIERPMHWCATLRGDDPRLGRCLHGLFREFMISDDQNAHARFRKLRKMASEAKDHEKEQQFNGYEVACRRFWVDKPFGPGAGRFWWGWLFGILSNYGQSLCRPIWTYVTLLAIGAWIFPAIGGLSVSAPDCHPTYEAARSAPNVVPLPETSVAIEAVMLSLRNALVFDKTDSGPRTFGCLYGVEVKGEKKDKLEPNVPNVVSLLSLLQRFLSAILLFLAGLAIRNMYRMK